MLLWFLLSEPAGPLIISYIFVSVSSFLHGLVWLCALSAFFVGMELKSVEKSDELSRLWLFSFSKQTHMEGIPTRRDLSFNKTNVGCNLIGEASFIKSGEKWFYLCSKLHVLD